MDGNDKNAYGYYPYTSRLADPEQDLQGPGTQEGGSQRSDSNRQWVIENSLRITQAYMVSYQPSF